ncbi:hypothetical protein [Rhizobium sp. SYY.PMSO]|uniref:hypothetical protein n=1 Tax=Rhizobium sp. SYY.PMSO TaxID=3382192 RepID=UPI0039902C34
MTSRSIFPNSLVSPAGEVTHTPPLVTDTRVIVMSFQNDMPSGYQYSPFKAGIEYASRELDASASAISRPFMRVTMAGISIFYGYIESNFGNLLHEVVLLPCGLSTRPR